jgi:enamine deaminase RidA (YjgF/YER057c/UK114 family)
MAMVCTNGSVRKRSHTGESRAGFLGSRSTAGNPGPANTMLYVAGLIGDGFLVEIEAQAVVLA